MLTPPPGFVQELERRQRRAGSRKRRLLLLLRALGFLDLGERRLDAQRRLLLLAALLDLDHRLALFARACSELAVGPPIPDAERGEYVFSSKRPMPSNIASHDTPMKRLKPIAANVRRSERRSREAEGGRQVGRQHFAEKAARREQQLGGEAMEAQALERCARARSSAKPPKAMPSRSESMRRNPQTTT